MTHSHFSSTLLTLATTATKKRAPTPKPSSISESLSPVCCKLHVKSSSSTLRSKVGEQLTSLAVSLNSRSFLSSILWNSGQRLNAGQYLSRISSKMRACSSSKSVSSSGSADSSRATARTNSGLQHCRLAMLAGGWSSSSLWSVALKLLAQSKQELIRPLAKSLMTCRRVVQFQIVIVIEKSNCNYKY